MAGIKRKVSNPLALAVLVLLYERPMHPYEMAATLRERHKEDSIKLRYGSLYTVIELLQREGYIAPKETTREGRRPERTVYALTRVGDVEMRDWRSDLLINPVKEYPQFEAALALLPVLPPDEVLALLKRRLSTIEQNSAALVRELQEVGGPNFPPLFLVESEYRLALMAAERDFVAGLINRIENGWGPLDLWRGFHEDREATMAKLYGQFGGTPSTGRK